jgi:hypothetical protein
MIPNTAQPIPDTEGEWRAESDEHGNHDLYNSDWQFVARARSAEIAAQIISDHKAAKSQALLVEAAGAALSLLRNIGTGKWANTPAGDKLRAALKAAGVEK